MRFLLAAWSEVVGLFVADWVQSAVIVAILAASWWLVGRVGTGGLVPLVLLLAVQHVWFARAEARRLLHAEGR
ncbi:MAG: hypothetical protein ACHQ0J_13250 [Candidatus Dormibacterales bacterium]